MASLYRRLPKDLQRFLKSIYKKSPKDFQKVFYFQKREGEDLLMVSKDPKKSSNTQNDFLTERALRVFLSIKDHEKYFFCRRPSEVWERLFNIYKNCVGDQIPTIQ